MTIPATTDYFLVQNQFHLASGLPEDVVVNTFIFKNQDTSGGTSGAAELRAADAVRDFFITAAPADGALAGASASAPMQFLSAAVTGWTQKVYDLGKPPGGRPPTVFDRQAEMIARGSGAKYPNEVAIVVSLQTPIIGRRGKGRFYLGPLVASTGADVTGGVGVAEAVRKRLCAQAAKLALGNGRDMEWAVWSTTRGKMARVIGGYVDDDFDTQRRRGLTSSFRNTFGTIVPTQPAA